MDKSMWILFMSTVSVAFFHALAPDHWMPFAAIGRAQQWSKLRLLWITFISGIGHVGISIVFSVIGIGLGFSLVKLKSIEGHRGEIALWLLIGFGLAYMVWGIKKGIEQKRSTGGKCCGHDHFSPDSEPRIGTGRDKDIFKIYYSHSYYT